MTNYYSDIYINEKYSLLCSTKYKPIVLNNVNKYIDDYYLNMKSVEEAESKMQEIVISELSKNNIDLVISGDLQNQLLASTLASSKLAFPLLGIYSACSTFIEGLIIAGYIANNKSIVVCTSSHNLVSEKQFRFPVEYGALRKRVNTCTATGSIGVIVSNKKSNIRLESSTIGNVIHTNHKDTNDMGSAMAPACAFTLMKHLKDTNRTLDYYDLILTGDLGEYGIKIMKKYYNKLTKKEINNIIDAGSIFYTEDNIYAGASGPAIIPLVLFDYIIPSKKYKKILVLGTGSLHSTLSSNLKMPIPSISHAISLEVSY